MKKIIQKLLQMTEQSLLIITPLEEKEKHMKNLVLDSISAQLPLMESDEAMVYHKMRYTQPDREFNEIKRVIDLINRGKGLHAQYDGVLVVDGTEYLGHEQEEYFNVFLKFCYDMICSEKMHIMFCITDNNNRDSVARFYAKLLEYIETDLGFDKVTEVEKNSEKSAKSLAKAYEYMNKLSPSPVNKSTSKEKVEYGQLL